MPVGPLAQGDGNVVMRPKRTDCVIKMMLALQEHIPWEDRSEQERGP